MESPRFRPADPDAHPQFRHRPYASTLLRSPDLPALALPGGVAEESGPSGWPMRGGQTDHDLTVQSSGRPIGERILVGGRVLDEDGRPAARTLVEVWQTNAAGRYAHEKDQWDAPLDPHFRGAGRALTDGEGRFEFITIRPGAYPWRNHFNAWRPAHIHFSVLGPAFATRLVTQMYFPGDPLIDLDPIACAVPEGARQRLVARLDMTLTRPEWGVGYAFDIVLRGRDATPMEA